MRLPHVPDPTEGVRHAVTGAAHAGASAAKRVADHIDDIEGRRNRHMKAQFRREGKKEEDGSWRTRGGNVWDPDLGRERKRAPAPTKPHASSDFMRRAKQANANKTPKPKKKG